MVEQDPAQIDFGIDFDHPFHLCHAQQRGHDSLAPAAFTASGSVESTTPKQLYGLGHRHVNIASLSEWSMLLTVRVIDTHGGWRLLFDLSLGFSESDLYVAVGGRIRVARERVGLTQEALGQLVGLGRTSITNIERGRQRMTVNTLFDVATALGEPAANLLPTFSAEPAPVLDSVSGLSDEERRWIRAVVSPAISIEGEIGSTSPAHRTTRRRTTAETSSH